MGKVIALEDYGLEVHRWPTKLEQIDQCLDILGLVETTGSTVGDTALYEATLALMNVRTLLEIGRRGNTGNGIKGK